MNSEIPEIYCHVLSWCSRCYFVMFSTQGLFDFVFSKHQQLPAAWCRLHHHKQVMMGWNDDGAVFCARSRLISSLLTVSRMGGKTKGKRRKGKGKVQAAGGGGPTPGAASWRWGGGGADNEQGGQKKYGNLTPEDIEAQARELAAQMGLAYDDGSGEEDSAAEEEEEEKPEGNAKVKGKRRIMVNEDDGSDGDGNDKRHNQKDMPKKKKKKKKCGEHAGRDSSGAEPSKKRIRAELLGRSEPPGWLMLEDGDLRETAVKAPKKPAAMWKQLGRAQRLLRAARLALGHPPAPKDLGMCSELVLLLGQWLRPLLGPGVCHGALEDLLSAKTCSSALQQAGASVEQLSRALPKVASSAGRLYDSDGDDDDDEEEEDAEEEGGKKEPNVPEAAANAWVRSVCSLDELFFQMHYAFRVAGPDAGIEPEGYLESVAPRGGLKRLLPRLPDPNDSKALKRSLGRIMGDGALSEVSMRGGCCEGANALLRIHWARLAEGAALFLRSGLSERIAGSPEWLSKQGGKAKGPPKRNAQPVAPGLIQAWRDTARDWVARLYTFAVPTAEALKEIVSLGVEVVEIGAGAGYWAYLLKRAGAEVTAYDVAPPTSDGAWNDYHGQAPSFTEVLQGGPEAAGAHPDAALLLCFPPPAEDMAAKCLENFSGRFVCHIGEWGGQTGDEQFEEMLLRDFEVLKVVPLPNWANTHYTLSLWSRRGTENGAGSSSGGAIMTCSSCKGPVKDLGTSCRSRLCNQLVYCSGACRATDSAGRKRLMRAWLLPVSHSKDNFEPLPVGGL